MKKSLSLILALVLLIGLLPMTAFATEETNTAGIQNPFEGKKVSILSHSMSTYAGVSNNTAANSTIGSNDVYYTEGRLGVCQKDTWWQQVIDALDMELLVNNSWSGSCVFMPRKGEASVGYGDRAVNLHNDHTGEEPDIIFVYLGCNDFAYYKDTFGEAADVNYAALITDNGDGTFTYTTPTNTCEAYAIMLHKVEHRYPDAEIYCMTSTARREVDYTGDTYPDAGQPTLYSAELQKIAKYFGYPVIDLENAIPKDVEIFDKYIGDKRAHANALGMDQITNEVLSVMLGSEAEICHVTADHGAVAEQAVLLGGSYYAEAHIPQGYSVVVTMGGKDVTTDAYKDGRIVIAEVAGDIHVGTVINRDPQNFRWEFQNGILTSIGSSENVLTKLSGTVANNILNDGIFQLNTPVVLKHDLPWVFEWKCSEDWRGAVLVTHKESATKGMTFLTRTKGGQLCFGTYTGSQYDNYGVVISGLNADTHTYRLENRIAADKSNMIWLYVDGEEIGPMNNYFIGSKDQNKTSDWVSGKDFVFSFIGMTGHALRNCQLDYLSVTECEHTYENGICTGCGGAVPALEGKTISILGASISTYAGTSNGSAADTTNSTIRKNVKYYPNTTIPEVTLNDTWWMQVTKDLGLRLLVNNAWSGSAILLERSGTVGAYVDRCVQLHDDTGDNDGEEPDIICIQMGFNDFSYGKDTLGTADIDYNALITADGYGTPATTMEATAIMLDKITKRYPNAEIYMFNHFKRIGQSASETTLMENLNASIATVCARYDVTVVDLYTALTEPGHIGDGRLHPNRLGMDTISEAVKEAIIEHTDYAVETHTVTLNLKGVTANYVDNKIVVAGDAFSVELNAADELKVTVTMGGKDITDSVYADGIVTIDSVTADVTVIAENIHTPKDYRWEFDGSDLACVSGGNALTKNAGTTTDGAFSKTRYALAREVILLHELPWAVEWKCEGTFLNTNGSSGARVFTSDDVNANYNARYIFKSNTNGIIAMGEKTTSGSHNYGIALGDYGIDWTALHTYRLENRISDDGSNMIYLLVDGVEIGPMNHYYIGTKDQNTTSDWLSGKDFVFPYMGTDTHGFTNASIDYIQVWEGGHSHTYENGVCTGCGATVSPYLQQLPENIIGCTNLYDSLVPVKGYYTATKYDTSNGAVLSVVIPVEPGDRIAASSFGPVSENMGSVNGIRVTYLLGDEIVTSLSAGDVYNGYTKNGYITVPDGVDAVCIPWWTPSDSNWLTLSQISKNFASHSPKTVSAQAPTCTENGYTAGEICEICDASLGSREEIPATGHDYSGNTCTVCGTVNILAILDGKYVSILGDSISTFNGYSNDATVNTTIGGNGPRYDAGTADTKPGSYCLLESVDDTWWMHFANRSGMKLLVNNSWAGSQVFGGQTSDGRVIPAAYLERCINLHDNTIENNPNNAPINPDVIFVYLGINDYNFNRSNVGNGTVDYAALINSDGTYVTPATFGEAYGILLHKMQQAYPNTQIFAMTLLPENLYSVDKTAWEQHNAYIRAAAEYYDIPVVDLAEKCAITWDNYSGYMMDKIHPTTAGMQLISNCIEAELVAYYTDNPLHTHSYTPTVTAPTCTEQGYTTYICDCGDSYVDDYKDATGHNYENGTCTACGVAQWDTDGDGVLEILAIGNSFSVDALQYAYQIAQDLGIEEIVLGNLYIGGCTLATHAANAAGDLGKYTYYYNDNGTWTSTGSYKISTALESRSWDYVSMQQGSPVSGVESSYNEDLTNLIAYVQERSDAKLVWHMTWAYQQNSTHSAFPTYNKDQMTMYNAIVSAVQNKIVTNSDIDLIVPNGTAVQNSRTSSLGDTTTRDGYHMSYDYGRYLTGLLFVKTVTGLSIDSVTYAPSGVDAEEKAIAVESANNAAVKPFAVTKSKYVNEVPEEGYILLKPELYKGAYWHPLKAGSYNKLIDDQSNSPNFFATIRFTRETLPVGSIITLKSGWQYRPDGWVTDALQTGTRESVTTKAFQLVTEEWWGDYTIRSFNISRTSGGSVMDLTEEEMKSIFQIYVPEEKHSHTYENGVCTLCGAVEKDCVWQVWTENILTGAYADLQSAVDACEDGSTLSLTADWTATGGATVENNITIDGGNHLVDISGCNTAFITVAEGMEVTIRDLALDGGATGFEVDYVAVTYTNYTIPLKAGSLSGDPKASQSAIISNGSLICENVDISNRYTASVGGAMQILAGSIKLTNCDFTHNYGVSKGGALYIGSNFGTRTDYPVEQVTITDCTFTNNYTGHGGAIYAYNMSEMVIENTDFTGNTANGGKGGAIDLFSETTKPTTAMALGLDFMQTSIRGCTFQCNWAGNDGFAIQSYDSDLYIFDSEFIENVGVHPTSSVGTVSIEAYRHADDSQRIYTLMDGCLFEGNQGPCAVYGDHSSISDLDVSNCVFRNNTGNDSFLLYAATSNITNCQFIGETMAVGVVDARIYENYRVLPLLTMTDVTFTDCDAPAEILTRKQNHNESLNTYQVVLQGTTNGDIAIWDGNAVSIRGTHTGNVQLDYDTERSSLTIGNDATIKGIIFSQPTDAEAKLGERYMVEVKAEGEGLTYQWYLRNAGSKSFSKSSVKDSTYDDVMTTARAGREIYCVITDANGNTVTTDTVKLICLPSEELAIVTQPTDGEAVMGERYCITVAAKGEGLKYQWYFRNAGSATWYKSGVRDNTYDDVMTTARDGREVYCVITDLAGNRVTTDTVKLVRVPMKLEITSQPTDAEAALGEMFCATVEAKGEGLKYQWYYRNAGSKIWHKSGVRDNTYDDVLTKARNGREIYCVITDKYGNSVTTDVVKLTAVPKVELKVLSQTYEGAARGERYCVTVEAEGEGLKYQWYFRNAGGQIWYKSSVKDNTYDDVMTKARANREVYCVITDAYGNQIVTDVVTLAQTK